jgi:uncharacterized spore protein YtfJ
MENIKTTVEELHKIIKIDNVVGEPIETEDKILIPVMRMGVGFGAGENILGKGGGAAGAGAGLEPISMVMIPKKGNTAEGVRVLSLNKASQTNKALVDLGLIISDIVKNYLGKEDADYDESEYIEPEFTTKVEIEDADEDE